MAEIEQVEQVRSREVAVGIDETGRGRGPIEIDDPRARPDQRFDGLGGTDRNDSPVLDGQALGDRVIGIHRDDVAVEEDRVGRQALIDLPAVECEEQRAKENEPSTPARAILEFSHGSASPLTQWYGLVNSGSTSGRQVRQELEGTPLSPFAPSLHVRAMPGKRHRSGLLEARAPLSETIGGRLPLSRRKGQKPVDGSAVNVLKDRVSRKQLRTMGVYSEKQSEK